MLKSSSRGLLEVGEFCVVFGLVGGQLQEQLLEVGPVAGGAQLGQGNPAAQRGASDQCRVGLGHQTAVGAFANENLVLGKCAAQRAVGRATVGGADHRAGSGAGELAGGSLRDDFTARDDDQPV